MEKEVYLKNGVVKLGRPSLFSFLKKRRIRIISGVTAFFLVAGSIGIGLTGCEKNKNEKSTNSASDIVDEKNKKNDNKNEKVVNGKDNKNLIDISEILFITPNLNSKNNSSGSYYGKVTGNIDLSSMVVGKDGNLYVDQKSADKASKIPSGQDKVVTYSTPGVVEGAPNGGVYDSQASANKIAEAKNNGTYIDPSNVHQDENGDWVLNSNSSYSNEQVFDNGLIDTVIDNNYGYTQTYVDNIYNEPTYTQPYVNNNYNNQTYTQSQLYYDSYGNAYFTKEDADAANRAIATDNFYENVNGQYEKVYR